MRLLAGTGARIDHWLASTTALLAMCSHALVAQSAPLALSGALRIGAAKVDITPRDLHKVNPNDFGDFGGVHDPVFARALVADNGHTAVAIVSLDVNQTGSTLALRQRIRRELGIAVDHILISVSHTHSAPMIGHPSPGSVAKSGGAEVDAYTTFVDDKVVAALRQAQAALQPAHLAVGTGHADVNVNRDVYTPRGYVYGHNDDGPSDKTVWVARFESSTGRPIAILFNYGVHPVVTRHEGLVSGDLPGAAERYIEQQLGDPVVALWTLGPAGDQDPKVYDLPAGASATAAVAPRPSGFDLMNAQGYMIGAEVVRVASQLSASRGDVRLAGMERVLTCPFKPGIAQQPYFVTAGLPPEQLPGVPIRLGLILIDDLAITAVSGEVLTRLFWRLRQASPLRKTVMVTMANDSSGYLIDDASFDLPTIEMRASPLTRGCAESGIVNGLVDMINAGIRQE